MHNANKLRVSELPQPHAEVLKSNNLSENTQPTGHARAPRDDVR